MSLSTREDYLRRQAVAGEQLSLSVAGRDSAAERAHTLRVLRVHSGNLYGGVEATLVAQARHAHLCPELEQSFALCFAGELSEELAAVRAPVYRLGGVRTSQPLSIWRARRALRDILRREHFGLVTTESAWSQAIFGPVIRAHGVPLIFWLHNAATGRHWLERWAGRTRPDLVICNSRFTADTLPNLYPNAAAEVISPPLISPEERGEIKERGSIRRQLDTPPCAIVIIQVGRMEEGKGHAELLKALGALKDLPSWVCWQVGAAQRAQEVEYFAQLKALADRLGIAHRVRFLGQRSDVESLLAAADIFCQPNTAPEGFGLTFVEALRSRLPVITAAIGGATEIVNNSCGLLVPPHDLRALTEALRRLIEDQSLRVRLGESGPARARELCDVETQLRRLHKAFVRLCK